MKARTLICSILALAGLAFAADAAFAQRFGGGMGGSIRGGMGPVTAGGMINPGSAMGMNMGMGGMGSMRYGWNGNNQGVQPGDLRVPFTYTPGMRWYNNRLPWGAWNGNWGGVPFFWYNNFWYRSMWWRGMPQFIPVPVETVPPQLMQNWTMWSQTPQGKAQIEAMRKQAEKEEQQQNKKKN